MTAQRPLAYPAEMSSAVTHTIRRLQRVTVSKLERRTASRYFYSQCQVGPLDAPPLVEDEFEAIEMTN